MSDSVEYAKMIGVPFSTCEYVYKKPKKSLSKQTFKKKVDSNLTTEKEQLICEIKQPKKTKKLPNRLIKEQNQDSVPIVKNKKFDIISVQVGVIFVLVLAIILTNIFWENSGMNSLFKSVFGAETPQVDARNFNDFSLNLPIKSQVYSLSQGVISVSGNQAIYPVCEGKIQNVLKSENGTYTVTIAHSDKFKSVIEGADFVYCNIGEKVNGYMPICFTANGAQIYLYNESNLLTDYVVKQDTLVWNK